MANWAVVQGQKKDNNDKTEGEEGVGDVRSGLTVRSPQQLTTMDTGESRGLRRRRYGVDGFGPKLSWRNLSAHLPVQRRLKEVSVRLVRRS